MFKKPTLRLVLVATVILAVFVIESAHGKKGGKPGGGGGGNSPGYQVFELDNAGGAVHNGWAKDINNVRQVVGHVDDAVGGTDRYAAYWEISEADGQIQSTLSILSDGINASGVNDAGEIVGQGEDASGAKLGMFWDGPNANPILLPPLPGHDRSLAQAINENGVICGGSSLAGGGSQTYRAVAWRVNWIGGIAVVSGPVELPGPADGSAAFSLNDDDENGVAEIVGVFEASQTAIVWEVQTQLDGSLTVAPVADLLDTASRALGINNTGAVCGQRDSEAVIWSGGSTITLDRPTKGKNKVASTSAYDISNAGVIVGIGGPGIVDARAVVWQSTVGKMTYLDSFLDSDSPLLGLTTAEAVNDFGEIVGEAWNGAFIAIPN